MPNSYSTQSRSAFTLVEVLIATAIIGIIAASAGLSFLKTRLNARNGQRKEVAQTYSKAVGVYTATAGTSFITVDATKTSCTANTATTNPTGLVSGIKSACVGANGRSFGMLNYSGTTSVVDKEIATALSTLFPDNVGTFTYSYSGGSSFTILDALKKLGYLDTISFDPSAKPTVNGGTLVISNSSPDYLLVRCCKDGRQAVGTGGSLYAIWAKLESGGSANVTSPDSNSQHLCGGSAVAPPTYKSPDGTYGTGSESYHYTFGATNTPLKFNAPTKDAADSYDSAWFAVGNSSVENLTSLSDSCQKNA